MIMGVDSGVNGGLAVLDYTGKVVFTQAFNKVTAHEMSDVFDSDCDGVSRVCLEKVSAQFNGGNVSSAFKQGEAFGLIKGLLYANKLSTEEVTPTKWQRGMSIPKQESYTKKKQYNRKLAQELFPSEKVTNSISDALLIAEYMRRQEVRNV